MSATDHLNQWGRRHALARQMLRDELVDRALLGMIDRLSPDGRQLLRELAIALEVTEIVDQDVDNFARAELGNFLRPEMSAFEKAIHEAYAMGLQLTP